MLATLNLFGTLKSFSFNIQKFISFIFKILLMVDPTFFIIIDCCFHLWPLLSWKKTCIDGKLWIFFTLNKWIYPSSRQSQHVCPLFLSSVYWEPLNNLTCGRIPQNILEQSGNICNLGHAISCYMIYVFHRAQYSQIIHWKWKSCLQT